MRLMARRPKFPWRIAERRWSDTFGQTEPPNRTKIGRKNGGGIYLRGLARDTRFTRWNWTAWDIQSSSGMFQHGNFVRGPQPFTHGTAGRRVDCLVASV